MSLVGHPHPNEPTRIYLRTLITVFCADDVLLIYQQHPPDPAYWNLLGGKVDLGEDPLDTAQRELKEEAGLLAPLQFRGVATAIVRSTGEHWAMFLFSARVADRTVTQSAEGPLRWVAPGELAALPVFPDIPLLLSQLRDTPSGVLLAKFVYATRDPATLDPTSIRVMVFSQESATLRTSSPA